jgi:hypothetical protein
MLAIEQHEQHAGEVRPMSREGAAGVCAFIIADGYGRVSDEGTPKKPWLSVLVDTEEEAHQLRAAFGQAGYAKPRRDRKGWRYGAFGNDALRVIPALLDAGLSGAQRALAYHLMETYGDGGRAWPSEVERLRANAAATTTREER